MAVSALNSTAAVAQPLLSQVVEKEAGFVPGIDTSRNNDANINDFASGRNNSGNILKFSDQEQTGEQPVLPQPSSDPPAQQKEFYSALLNIQEKFVRSFEDISDVPVQLGALFQEADQNQDGVISFDEFFPSQPQPQTNEEVVFEERNNDTESLSNNGVTTSEPDNLNEQFQRRSFERLQEQIQSFQNNLGSPSRESELAVV